MICRWVENPKSDALKRHILRIHDYLWIAEDGMKTKVLYILLQLFLVFHAFSRDPTFRTENLYFK
jgi:hypothetical protein